MVMADGLPRFLPDAFLRVQFRTVWRKRNKLNPFNLAEKFAKPLVPWRIIPKDPDTLARISLQEPT